MESNYKFGFKDLMVILLAIVLIIVMVMFFKQRDENNSMVAQLNNEKDSIKTQLTQMLVN